MRYLLRKLAKGWSVWDTETKSPADIDGHLQSGLNIKVADDAAILLQCSRPNEQERDVPPPEEDLGGGDICSLERTPTVEDDRPL